MASLVVTLPLDTDASAQSGCAITAKAGGEPPVPIALRSPKDQKWMSAEGQYVHVWWWKGQKDSEKAKTIICDVETAAWANYSTLMHMEPGELNDGAIKKNGGPDSKIDIAIIPPQGHDQIALTGRTMAAARPYYSDQCKPTPSYIVTRQEVEDGFRETLAHELFHSFQMWVDQIGGCVIKGGLKVDGAEWLAESTAEWATHWVYPEYAHNYSQFVLQDPENGLLYEERKKDLRYASYLFFLFAGSGVVSDAWAERHNTRNIDQFKAVNKSLDGGWLEQWPKFAAETSEDLRSVLDGYLDDWQSAYGARNTPLPKGTIPIRPYSFDTTGEGLMPEKVRALGFTYWHVRFPETGTRRVDVKNLYKSLSANVQIFKKFPGEGWSKDPKVLNLGQTDKICRRPEELLIVASNSARSGDPLPAEKVKVTAFGEANACRGPTCRFVGDENDGCPGLKGTLQYTRTWDENSSSGDFTYNHEWDGTLDIRLQEGEEGGWVDDGTSYSLQGSGTSSYATSLCTVDTTTTWSGSGLDAPNYFLQDSKFNLRIQVEVDGVDQNSYSGELCSGSDTTDDHDFWVVECSNGVMTVDPTTSQLIITFGPELDAEYSTDVGDLHADETQNCTGELKTEIPPPEG